MAYTYMGHSSEVTHTINLDPQHWMEVKGQLALQIICHRERTSGINWIGEREGPRAVLDMVVKSKIPTPLIGM